MENVLSEEPILIILLVTRRVKVKIQYGQILMKRYVIDILGCRTN